MTPEEYLEVIFPSMVTVSGYSKFISIAQETVSSGFFGNQYNLAVALKAAHLYELMRRRAGVGSMITQKTEGRLSISYAGNASVSNELQLTSYGVSLLNLINSINAQGTISDTAIYDQYLGG